MSARVRVDRLLVDRGLVESRERAQAMILAGRVFSRGQRVEKPGTQVTEDTDLELRGDPCPYVSRGGLKLVGVLEPLGISVLHRICADIGASTGGFTDVLLQHGATRVYAVDVGKGQLHQKLRTDPRVVVREGINARADLITVITEPVSLVVMDLSFISLTKVIPALLPVLTPEATVLAMVKPQFELSPREVGRGGVVREDELRYKAVDTVAQAATLVGLLERGRQDSPVHGPSGNREIFLRLDRTEGPP
ncbi:MAG: TlyA family RNA methyltransferase [Deltaproteobacteria bacterium]|nr:TlyA family RNA methyltransferase [Deltaproteobacteria bacterium]